MGLLFLFIFYFFWKILFYLQGKRDFQKQKNLDQFLTLEKAKTGPRFGVSSVKNWFKSLFWPPLAFFVVSNLSTFFGSNFLNLIRNSDNICKREQKTTCNSIFDCQYFVHPIVSILSTKLVTKDPDFSPKNVDKILTSTWSNYWLSNLGPQLQQWP